MKTPVDATRKPRARTGWLIAAGAGAVFVSVWLMLRALERRAAFVGVDAALTPEGQLRPIAEVAASIASLKLVTVEVYTSATSLSADPSWRGEAYAEVTAPVRLLYGCDLSNLSADRLAYSPTTSTYIIRIPPPERIASEVFGMDESAQVRVGWGRLRSRAGEYQLGLARKGLREAAERVMLSPEDAEYVRRTTLDQVRSLARKIVGPAPKIVVRFDEVGP